MLFFDCCCRICFIHRSTGQLFVAASCSFQFCTVVAQLPRESLMIILVGVSTCDLDSRKVVAGHVLRSGSSRTNAGSGLAGLHCHLCGGAGCHNCWSQPQIAHQQKLVEMRNGCGTCRLHLQIWSSFCLLPLLPLCRQAMAMSLSKMAACFSCPFMFSRELCYWQTF